MKRVMILGFLIILSISTLLAFSSSSFETSVVVEGNNIPESVKSIDVDGLSGTGVEIDVADLTI